MSTTVTMTLDELKTQPPISEDRLKEIEEFEETFSDPECPPTPNEELKNFKPWYMFRKDIDQQDPFLDNDLVDLIKSRGMLFRTQLNQFLRKAVAAGQI